MRYIDRGFVVANEMSGSDFLKRRVWLALLSLCLVLFIWQQVGMFSLEPVFPVDDSYITLQNANELLGNETAFRNGGSLSGATSIAHTLLVAAFILLTQNDLLALSLASLLGAWLYLIGMTELARCYTNRMSSIVAVCFAAAFLAYTSHQLANGLETSWAMAAVAWSLYLYSRHTESAARWLCLLLGAMPFIRPELIALSALLGALQLYRYCAINGAAADVRSYAFKLAGYCLLGALPFLLINFFITGAVIPNTIGAKKVYFAEGCRDFAWKWQTFVFSSGWLLKPWWLVFIGIIGLVRTVLGRVLLLFAVIFYAAYIKSFAGALGHYEGRYQYVLLPVIVYGLLNVLVWLQDRNLQRFQTVGAAGIVIAVLAVSVPAGLELAGERREFTASHLYPVADWLAEHVTPEQTVLVHDAGYVGYALNMPVLNDLVGLKTPANIKYHEQITWPSCGAERPTAIAAILLEAKPDFAVVYNVWDRIFGISYSFSIIGAQLEPLLNTGQYSIYAVQYAD
jgi:hypothetical protein